MCVTSRALVVRWKIEFFFLLFEGIYFENLALRIFLMVGVYYLNVIRFILGGKKVNMKIQYRAVAD